MSAVATYRENQVESVREFARDSVANWSELCQQCLDYQPAPEKLAEHINTLKWLLRFARVLHVAASDPEYPDRQIADELEGRMIQLEHAWRQFNNPLAEREAAELEAALFA